MLQHNTVDGSIFYCYYLQHMMKQKPTLTPDYRTSVLLPPELKVREFTVRYRFEKSAGTMECLDLPAKEWQASATEKLTVDLCKKMGWNVSDFRDKATIAWL